MIAQNIKKIYQIKSEIKSALESLGKEVDNVFSHYPGLITRPESVDSFFQIYFEPGPDIEEEGGVWKTEKCIFDDLNEHLIKKEFVSNKKVYDIVSNGFHKLDNLNVYYVESSPGPNSLEFKVTGYQTFDLPVYCISDDPENTTVKIYVNDTEVCEVTVIDEVEIPDYEDMSIYTKYPIEIPYNDSTVRIEFSTDSNAPRIDSILAIYLP